MFTDQASQCVSLNNTSHQRHSAQTERCFGNLIFFLSACPNSGKLGSSLPQFSMSLRVVPSGRGWWGPAEHNVCFSLRLPLYSAAPAWLWRVAKLWGVVRASGGACTLAQNRSKHLTSFPHDRRPDINHFPGLAGYSGMLREDIVMNNQTNCNKQCEVMCKWLRILLFHIQLLQRLNHRVGCAMPT